jgi:hypothetical protein
MTVLIGASVLLIAGSAIALVFGWVSANESLIWTSIVASAGAAVTLALAFFRSRQEATAGARRSVADPPGSPEEPETQLAAASAETPTATEGADIEVVGIRDSKRFHRPECRYAGSKGAEKMTKGAAQKAGFRACGVCKP